MPQIYHNTPVGIARLTETDGAISSISITDTQEEIEQETTPILLEAAKQLDEYFAGERKVFDLNIRQEGSPFQQGVWKILQGIEYGKTITYAQQASMMGNPLAIRAIAASNGKNHLWVVVPCHRVIGSNGSLTGYAGGLWRKKWLLEHETKVLGIGQTRLF